MTPASLQIEEREKTTTKTYLFDFSLLKPPNKIRSLPFLSS
jgi:hypothetical protein